MRKKKTITMLMIIVFILGSSMLLYYLSSNQLTVNGESISEEEYGFYQGLERAEVSAYFYNLYDAQSDTRDFWSTSFEGETPEDILQERTIKEIVNTRSIFELADKYGIKRPESFEALKQDHSSINKERKKDSEAGETVYGPVKLSFHQYYLDVLNKLEQQLKVKLKEDFFNFSEEELKEYFESLDERLFHKGYEGTVHFYYIDSEYFGGDNDSQVLNLFDELNAYLTVNKEVPINELVDQYQIPVSKQIYETESSSTGKDDETFLQMEKMLSILEVDKVSDVVEIGPFIGVMKVLEKEDLGFSTFEENKEIIIREYLDVKYKELIENMISKAKVKGTINKL